MKPILVAYLAQPKFGGWPVFTAHLLSALRAANLSPHLIKVGNRTESRMRDFGYGAAYQNLSAADFESSVATQPSIIAAADGSVDCDAAVKNGAWLVVHDPTEFKALSSALPLASGRLVTIRKSVAGLLTSELGVKNHFILHPYERMRPQRTDEWNAVAYSRLDWDKHTELICAANRFLAAAEKIRIYGSANRLYVFHKLTREWPSWKSQYFGAFPPKRWGGAELAARARFVIDMSLIARDGGGSQYTFLEAWDAGATLVVQRRWLAAAPVLREGTHLLACEGAEELARRIKEKPPPEIAAAAEELLALHEPAKIGRCYAALLA